MASLMASLPSAMTSPRRKVTGTGGSPTNLSLRVGQHVRPAEHLEVRPKYSCSVQVAGRAIRPRVLSQQVLRSGATGRARPNRRRGYCAGRLSRSSPNSPLRLGALHPVRRQRSRVPRGRFRPAARPRRNDAKSQEFPLERLQVTGGGSEVVGALTVKRRIDSRARPCGGRVPERSVSHHAAFSRSGGSVERRLLPAAGSIFAGRKWELIAYRVKSRRALRRSAVEPS